MLLHKASVTAVGGRRMTKQSDSATIHGNSNIVTIRARRSQSFAIRRKLEMATTGRKRSNTIGSGRQTESRSELQKGGQSRDSFPQADKQSRRVQSMIIEAKKMPAVTVKFNRNRCVTVTPLRLELQRLMSRSRATQRPRRKNMLQPIAEQEGIDACGNASRRSLEHRRSQSIQMAANALCAQQSTRLIPANSRQNALKNDTRHKLSSCGPYKLSQHSHNVHMRNNSSSIKRMSCQTAFVSAPDGQKQMAHRLYRSKSCPSRINTANICRKSIPIQPAIMRYLASANPKRYNSLPVIKRMPGAISRSATLHTPQSMSVYASSYQRINLAMLSRPSAANTSNAGKAFK
ncbi:hypothetical protein FB639_005071 [Coemansia asiatica]|nr:hypothetical protein FB639_005071 [Coemansia asiatica]